MIVVRGAAWKFVMFPITLAAVGISLFVLGSTSSGFGHAAAKLPRAQVNAPRASVGARRASVSAASRVRPPDHIAVIVMENESYADVIGSPAAPFITRLA